MAQGLPVADALHELAVRADLWNGHALRTAHAISPHRHVSDIWMRFNAIPTDPAAVVDDCEAMPYEAWWALPETRALVMRVFASLQGERLGRVIITRLAPGKAIEAHADAGAPATYYERAHLVLQGLPGSLFYCGNEQVCMRTGELWWIDNSQVHSVVNSSADDRLHIIIDYKRSRL